MGGLFSVATIGLRGRKKVGLHSIVFYTIGSANLTKHHRILTIPPKLVVWVQGTKFSYAICSGKHKTFVVFWGKGAGKSSHSNGGR
jgi:hypothetical protein